MPLHEALQLLVFIGTLERNAGIGFGGRAVVGQLEQPAQQHGLVAEAGAAARLDGRDDLVAQVGIGAAEVEQEMDVGGQKWPGLPGLHPGTQFGFVRPGIARLHVDLPVQVGDVPGVDDAGHLTCGIALGEVFADEFGIDGAIDHGVGHMDAAWPQFACHALGECAQTVLGAREGRKALAAAQAGGGAREQDGAAPARQHGLGRLAAHEKPRKAGHLPDLEVHACRGVRDAESHIGADVEDCHLDGGDLGLDLLDQGHHLLFLARVQGKAVGLAAVLADAVDQRLQLVGIPASDAGHIALTRKALGDGTARGVARADDQDGFSVLHGVS
ncbi:hypothetical protein FQR65_LT20262 [Abscondita terminalis]|nr:hypothetical protein FQR65_LT20262 [Abscondita terminalis]